MIKANKKLLIITSVVILLPVLFGLTIWNQLPDKLPTHWNAQGEIDGWGSKVFAVFGLPGIMLATQWLCMIGTSMDPKRKNINDKLLKIVLWICPILSVAISAMIYITALGKEVRVEKFIMLLVGALFVIIGNYLPKCKQSYTMGIKLPWTLEDEENWNKTHRMGGKLWVACGVIVMLCAFVSAKYMQYIMLATIISSALVPTIYSYCLYKKKENSGE